MRSYGNQQDFQTNKSMSWRSTVPYLGEAVFPGISSPQHTYGPPPRHPTLASLPLQVSIYFNVVFFPVWLLTTIVMMTVKVDCLSNLYRLIAITVATSASCIEMLRLYLGYVGNLSEKIPEVAAFWMLSILLQFPLQVFLTANTELRVSVLEYTVQSVMLLMLISQLVLGFIALRSAASTQAARFHMAQKLSGKNL